MNKILLSLIGLLIFPQSVRAQDAVGTITPPAELANVDASGFINSLVGIFIAIAGVLFLFLLLWGGIKYMTAGGDPKNAEGARKILTNALIGLIIVIGAYFIVSFLGSVLGIDFLNPEIPGL